MIFNSRRDRDRFIGQNSENITQVFISFCSYILLIQHNNIIGFWDSSRNALWGIARRTRTNANDLYTSKHFIIMPNCCHCEKVRWQTGCSKPVAFWDIMMAMHYGMLRDVRR